MNRKDEIMKAFGIQETESKDKGIQQWINDNCEHNKLSVDKLESLIDVWSIAFINTLVQRFKDAKSWQIIGFTECEVKENKFNGAEDRFFVVEKKSIAGELKPRKHYKENSEDEDSIFKYEYIWQTQGVSEKDYYGTIMFPINTNIFLKVAYAF